MMKINSKDVALEAATRGLKLMDTGAPRGERRLWYVTRAGKTVFENFSLARCSQFIRHSTTDDQLLDAWEKAGGGFQMIHPNPDAHPNGWNATMPKDKLLSFLRAWGMKP